MPRTKNKYNFRKHTFRNETLIFLEETIVFGESKPLPSEKTLSVCENTLVSSGKTYILCKETLRILGKTLSFCKKCQIYVYLSLICKFNVCLFVCLFVCFPLARAESVPHAPPRKRSARKEDNSCIVVMDNFSIRTSMFTATTWF